MSYKLEKLYTDTQRADFIAEHQGLNYYEDDNCIIMYSDTEKIVNGEAIDRTQDTDYKLQQFQKSIQYQHDAFDEYSREIVYQIQYNTALGNTTLILDLEEQLQAEQQAVIARINDITTAYNGGST